MDLFSFLTVAPLAIYLPLFTLPGIHGDAAARTDVLVPVYHVVVELRDRAGGEVALPTPQLVLVALLRVRLEVGRVPVDVLPAADAEGRLGAALRRVRLLGVLRQGLEAGKLEPALAVRRLAVLVRRCRSRSLVEMPQNEHTSLTVTHCRLAFFRTLCLSCMWILSWASEHRALEKPSVLLAVVAASVRRGARCYGVSDAVKVGNLKARKCTARDLSLQH